jgi:hypothetical protein
VKFYISRNKGTCSGSSKFLFQGIKEPAVAVVKAIWRDLVQTLKGEWSSIEGISERCRKQRRTFRCIWDSISVYEYSQGNLWWQYKTP